MPSPDRQRTASPTHGTRPPSIPPGHVLVSRAPAQAKGTKTYEAYAAICEESAQGSYDYWSDAAGEHLREYWHFGPVYFLVKGSWEADGTLRVEMAQSDWSATSGYASGSFALRDSRIGDADGLWTWDYFTTDGHGIGPIVKKGKAKGSVDVTFHREDPSGLPQPPSTPCGSSPTSGYVYLTIRAS